jgi:hypothetical protein
MTKKDKRPVYEPPRARDLSAQSVSGQIGPLGTCSFGEHPYTDCITGEMVGTADCSPGDQVEVYPQCRGGSWAHSACLQGGQAG